MILILLFIIIGLLIFNPQKINNNNESTPVSKKDEYLISLNDTYASIIKL